jgi:hypothetical protein
VLNGFWFGNSDQSAVTEFLNGWIELIESMSNGHIYQNYPRLGEPQFAWRYWGDAQAGLYAVKLKYDPGQIFQFAQCVPPPIPSNNGFHSQSILPSALQAALDQPIVYSQRTSRRCDYIHLVNTKQSKG